MVYSYIVDKKSFIFNAHSHKINGPKSNGDTDVTFNVDTSQTPSLAPFIFIEPNTALKITVEIEQ